jgi:hypothetical protein
MAAAPMVDENDGAAKGLGYVADTAKADGKKYPKHTKETNVHQLRFVPGQGNGRRRWLPAVCWQASDRQGLVQRLRQKGLNLRRQDF